MKLFVPKLIVCSPGKLRLSPVTAGESRTGRATTSASARLRLRHASPGWGANTPAIRYGNKEPPASASVVMVEIAPTFSRISTISCFVFSSLGESGKSRAPHRSASSDTPGCSRDGRQGRRCHRVAVASRNTTVAKRPPARRDDGRKRCDRVCLRLETEDAPDAGARRIGQKPAYDFRD